MSIELTTISPGLQTAARQLYYRQNMQEFFAKQLKIRTKEIGYAQLIPNVVQRRVLEGVRKQLKEQGKIRQLWFKGRQVGSSTLASAIIFHKTSLFPGVNSFAVAQDKVTAAKLFSMSDLFYKSMDHDIRPTRSYFTKGTELVMGHDPRDQNAGGITSNLLCGQAKEINLAVGSTLHCLHLSEIARYPSSAPLTESLFPACSDAQGTIRVIESTAHFGNCSEWFKDQCQRAMAGRGEYRYQFIPWWEMSEYQIPLKKGEKFKLDAHSEYPDEKHLHKKIGLTLTNLKWRRSKIDEYGGDVELFHLSYPTDFLEGWITKDASAFPYGRLTEMQQHIRPPIARYSVVDGKMYRDDEGLLQIWKMPEPGKMYDIGGDVAGGDGSTDGMDNARFGDYSVLEVVQRGFLEQCAEWRGHVLPREFADILAAVGRFYNNAQIGSEINSFGMSTLERLRDISYPDIYLWRKRDGVSIKFTGKMGWMTTYESKNVIVNLLREKLYYRQVIFHSKILWDEARNFVRDFTPTGMITYAGANGFYDDTIMAFMIAVQISEDENMERFNSVHQTKSDQGSKPQPDPCFSDTHWDRDLNYLDEESSLRVDTGSWRN